MSAIKVIQAEMLRKYDIIMFASSCVLVIDIELYYTASCYSWCDEICDECKIDTYDITFLSIDGNMHMLSQVKPATSISLVSRLHNL